MTMADAFIARLDRETTSTRRTLERVPNGRPDWRPHPKSIIRGRAALAADEGQF